MKGQYLEKGTEANGVQTTKLQYKFIYITEISIYIHDMFTVSLYGNM